MPVKLSLHVLQQANTKLFLNHYSDVRFVIISSCYPELRSYMWPKLVSSLKIWLCASSCPSQHVAAAFLRCWVTPAESDVSRTLKGTECMITRCLLRRMKRELWVWFCCDRNKQLLQPFKQWQPSLDAAMWAALSSAKEEQRTALKLWPEFS